MTIPCGADIQRINDGPTVVINILTRYYYFYSFFDYLCTGCSKKLIPFQRIINGLRYFKFYLIILKNAADWYLWWAYFIPSLVVGEQGVEALIKSKLGVLKNFL